MKRKILSLLLLVFYFMVYSQDKSYFATQNHNPVIPGYFADPTMVCFNNKYYLYSTSIEPMVWISDDLQTWEIKPVGISGLNSFWAPSILKGDNGKYYLYYTSGNDFKCHLYIGESPTGPWIFYDLVEQGFDLQIFRDTNTGKVYGCSSDPGSRPRLVEFESNVHNPGYLTKVLKEKSLEGSFFDYTEGSFLLYRDGWYYLMYSGGKCTSENYKINYSRSKNIWGPYDDAPNNPILIKNDVKNIFGPGHHSVFMVNDQYFIVYHRLDYYFYPNTSKRQVCIDKMEFDDKGWIKPIEPTNAGIDFSKILNSSKKHLKNVAFGKNVTASSINGKFNPEFAVDENYGTYWEGGGSGFFSVDLAKEYNIEKIIPQFLNYNIFLMYKIMYSSDNQKWEVYYDQSQYAQKALTTVVNKPVKARYVMVKFDKVQGNMSLCELEVLAE